MITKSTGINNLQKIFAIISLISVVFLMFNFANLNTQIYALAQESNTTSQLDFRQSSIPPNNTKINNQDEIKYFLDFRNTGEKDINNLVFAVDLVNSLDYISCHTPNPLINCEYNQDKKQILFSMNLLEGLQGKNTYPDFYEIYFVSKVNSNQPTALSNVFVASSKQVIGLNSNIIYHVLQINPDKYTNQISNFENLEKVFNRKDLQKDSAIFDVKTNPSNNFLVNQYQNLIYTLEIKPNKNQNNFVIYSLLDGDNLQDFECLTDTSINCFFDIYKGKLVLIASGQIDQNQTKTINLSTKVKYNTKGNIDQQFLFFLPENNQLFGSENMSHKILELKNSFTLTQESYEKKDLVETDQELTYFINFGSSNLQNYKSIIITTKLDSKLEYIEKSCFPNNSKGQTCSLQGDTLIWRLNNLDFGEINKVAFRANVKKDSQGQIILNSEINSGNITQTSQPLIQNIRQKNDSSLIILDSKIPNIVINTATAYPKLSTISKERLESINSFGFLNVILPRTGSFVITSSILVSAVIAIFLMYKRNMHLKISKKLDLKRRIGEDNLINKFTILS